jgi:hypothetical protein
MILNSVRIDKAGSLINIHKTRRAPGSPQKFTYFVGENEESDGLLQGIMTVLNTGTVMEPA